MPPRVELDHTHGIDTVDALVEPFEPFVPCRRVSCLPSRLLFYPVRLGSIRLASGSAVDLGTNCPGGSALPSLLGAGVVRQSMNLVIFAFFAMNRY